MDRIPVSSESLTSVGYDTDHRVLEIEFRNGRVYQYFMVPHQVFLDLVAAPSKGGYFTSRIKDVYRFKQLQ